MSFLSKIFNFSSDPLKTHAAELAKINSFKAEIEGFSSEQIKVEIEGFKKQLKEVEEIGSVFKLLEQIRPRVFALTREAAKRSIGQFHYDVQIVGGIVLSQGQIAEMRTGEGKTLTATLPLVLHALAGKGSHLVTVNDYLSRWQASLMGPVFAYLGLSVASIQHEQSFIYDPNYQPEAEEIAAIEGEVQGLVMDVKHMRPVTRREAYNADITYGTNNEYGFDYLRDNMAQNSQQVVQRELFFAIVDEVDSILIDEARTPLIISQPDTDPTDKYHQFSRMVEQLQEEADYTVDEKHKSAGLTDEGINKIEKILKVDNIYDTSKGVTTLHHIEQALRAKTLFKLDRDYVVREGEIIIVDEFTGRLMFGRRYSEGLHQAIEAKENVKIQQESKTLATITFQNLFRLYDRLAGMTGTGKTEEEEFFKIYSLTVITIPTNQPMIRGDLADIIYKTEKSKFKAIAKDVRQRHKAGQPVLIGTVSIAKNELLAEYLRQEGLRFETLNAKNHEREAQIIAQAGRLGAITLATNIAGRGVDIFLGGNPVDEEEVEKVRAAGGLHVLGTERHESRRIDNQLRGRSGRQGDPGSSQFFVSMEDDLMRLFGGERMKNLMSSLGLPDDEPIKAGIVSKSLEQAQKKIEGLNFDTRKHVLEFDDVLNLQRTKIYRMRKQFLVNNQDGDLPGGSNEQIKEKVLDLLKTEVALVVSEIYAQQEDNQQAISDILEKVSTIFPLPDKAKEAIDQEIANAADKEFATIDAVNQMAQQAYESKVQEIGPDVYSQVVRMVALQAIDLLWMEHLDTMDHLRDSVRLRGYGQRDPLVEYKKEGYQLFKRLLDDINRQIAYTILRVNVQAQTPVMELSNTPAMANPGNNNQNFDQKNIGRNQECPCGSGKKFKRCHGASQ